MRRLLADEIECRVAQVTSKGCSLLLYKTARVDRAILDEEFGQFGWQNDFKVIDGKMYGGIGVCFVSIDEKTGYNVREWIWKWDCGTESNTEQEKGQASDCFKRAGFKWGIGVELYTAPFIFAQLETVKNDKGKYDLKDKYIKFEVKEIGYSDAGEINLLKIADNKGNIVFELGKNTIAKKQSMFANVTAAVNSQLSEKDVDIIAGLEAADCKENAYTYFKKFEKEVDNFPYFKSRYAQIYSGLPSLEQLQNGGQ